MWPFPLALSCASSGDREDSFVPGLEGPGSWWQFLPLYLALKFTPPSFPSIPSLPWPLTSPLLVLKVGSVHACVGAHE